MYLNVACGSPALRVSCTRIASRGCAPEMVFRGALGFGKSYLKLVQLGTDFCCFAKGRRLAPPRFYVMMFHSFL